LSRAGMVKPVRYAGSHLEKRAEKPRLLGVCRPDSRLPLLSVQKALKQQMAELVTRRLRRQHRRNGTGHSVTERMTRLVNNPDKDTLVIGFARRSATYKRATLIFSDLERLERILTNTDCPVVIVFAGKAHPRDNPGQ